MPDALGPARLAACIPSSTALLLMRPHMRAAAAACCGTLQSVQPPRRLCSIACLPCMSGGLCAG